jgi:hypothetical protein
MSKNILAALFLSLLLGRTRAQFQVSIAYTTIKLLNFYPVGHNECMMTLAFNDGPRLTRIVSCLVQNENDHYTFTSPLAYLTRHWQIKQLGQITYHYADNINLTRARAFEKNNETIAGKLGLTPEKFDFYLTDNYQEIPPLLGYNYDPERVGRTRDGSFTSEHQIFAIQHNEDFSHDLIHYYVSKIRTSPRNAAAEEGLAYYWGNAYYTDSGRNMIDYSAQLAALKSYMREHPDTSLLSLFDHNAKPFPTLAPEVSARSTLSARLFQLIEETRGIEGVKTLINCGRGDDNYFKTLDTLTAINRANFDTRLRALLTP